MVVTERGRRISKLFLIPQRWVLAIMGSFAIVNAYTMRVSLSIAMTEMITHDHYKTNASDVCPKRDKSIHAVSKKDSLYDWDDATQGWILSSFYLGYTITQIPGGTLSEIFGGKQVLNLGILFTSICTIFTPSLMYWTKGSAGWLIALRIIEGLGEGPTYPALTSLLGQWVPLAERSAIGTIVYSGAQLGTILSNLLSGHLIAAVNHWSIVFYFFGGIGILWCALWQVLCYSSPDQHPFIKDEEVEFLDRNLPNVIHGKRKTPWKHIVCSCPVWALFWAQVGHDWGFFSMVTCLPKYLKEVLWFKIKDNGLWTSAPYILMWVVSLTSGFLCDWMYKRKMFSLGCLRKFFTSVASLGPGVFIMIASYVGCDHILAVWMFTISMGFMGVFYCGMKVNSLDLSPNFAGSVMGLVNGLGALTGFIAPIVISYLTNEHSLKQWRNTFWICFAIFNVTNIIYLWGGSAKEQWWNDPLKTGPDPKPPKNAQGPSAEAKE